MGALALNCCEINSPFDHKCTIMASADAIVKGQCTLHCSLSIEKNIYYKNRDDSYRKN